MKLLSVLSSAFLLLSPVVLSATAHAEEDACCHHYPDPAPAPAPAPAPQVGDPFDPASCQGDGLTPQTAAAFFHGGDTQAVLGAYQMVFRKRSCTVSTGCTAWVSTAETLRNTTNMTKGASYSAPTTGRLELLTHSDTIVFAVEGDYGSTIANSGSTKLSNYCGLLGNAMNCYGTRLLMSESDLPWAYSDIWAAPASLKGNYYDDQNHMDLNAKDSGSLVTAHCARLTSHNADLTRDASTGAWTEVESGILVRY